jgi:outer membrane protein W
MRTSIKTSVISLYILLLTTAVVHAAGHNAFMVSGGVYGFQHTNQSVERVYGTGTECIFSWCFEADQYEDVELKFSHKYEKTIAFQYEHIFRNGLVLEGNLGYLQSHYIMFPAQVTGLTGEGKVQMTMLSTALKYYYNEQGLLQPFVGAGIGFYYAKLNAPVAADFLNYIIRFNLGVSTKISRYRIFLAYTNAQRVETDSNATKNLNLSGDAINLGVGWMF